MFDKWEKLYDFAFKEVFFAIFYFIECQVIAALLDVPHAEFHGRGALRVECDDILGME